MVLVVVVVEASKAGQERINGTLDQPVGVTKAVNQQKDQAGPEGRSMPAANFIPTEYLWQVIAFPKINKQNIYRPHSEGSLYLANHSIRPRPQGPQVRYKVRTKLKIK